ncbi:DNA polymerase III, gamma subunit /DNA polymerase III, tau subunit [Pseudidiomarina planktonica]|uniref:DNA polymerase III subunit gamma/tau n=1 Tax=Pseudidiomarina planktonica TaxID=1323738 RepID=A0A1Y6F207_9GAMM|nr:DNA polymerase III subunit gamma/tau [Pseudidiomarina planktonica]RUO64952.1 DNA polymerase III subunit gamma/tau [Pseudidiomarina planktonica]SMQ68875.1 DNA polymerase III, gamma subunit /DNA polymerase III, tau subunit [Pseudidiomarina planktonica]
MSYQVLARKWRPQTFTDVVGQQHVLRPLISALESQRLHHAYLFTGTRGVGKTTIARILAKSLNCEQGIQATPCGECGACKEIDSGRFVDLLEIDAASRTKVEDTRELLDNVQYRPTRGRYKVYLIDEVHMLSRHSFNALLKTLEEPPEHVKFLLATTDPQKLPVTVLSRCLQFNLKALSRDEIAGHIDYVLQQEKIPYDKSALPALARAAQGSLRDALSLTDQAIAQGQQSVSQEAVQTMLGAVPGAQIAKLLNHIIRGQGAEMLALLDSVAGQIPDLSSLLTELQYTLHQLALIQVVPESAEALSLSPAETRLAQQIPAELVQVMYDIVAAGRRDLPFAADARSGVEMTLLRLLAFRPEYIDVEETSADVTTQERPVPAPPASATATASPAATKPEPATEDTAENTVENKVEDTAASNIEAKAESGMPNQDANNSAPATSADTELDSLADSYQDNEDDADELFAAQEEIQTQADQLRGTNSTANTPQPETPQRETPAPEQASANATSSAMANLLATRSQLTQKKKPLNKESEAKLCQPEVKTSTTADEDSRESLGDAADNVAESATESATENVAEVAIESVIDSAPQQQASPEAAQVAPASPALTEPAAAPTIEFTENAKLAAEVDRWSAIVDTLPLTGLSRQLALNAVLHEHSKTDYEVRLAEQHKHLLNDTTRQNLIDALAEALPDAQVRIEVAGQTEATPLQIQQQLDTERAKRARAALENDPQVQALQKRFGATMIEESLQVL